MQNLKIKAMAAAMAAITAVTPVLSTYTEVFAETVDDYSGSESVNGTVKIETEAGSSQEDVAETVDTSDNPFLFIKIQSDGGTVIVNEGEKNEQRIRLVKEKDAVSEETVSKINIYDKDDILISNENAEANNYTYVYETAAASAVTLKALADDGYQVEKFDISKTVDGIDMSEDSDFKKGVDKYENIVFMTENKKAEIGFAKKGTKEIADTAESNDLITVDGKADKTDETEADITKAEEGSDDLSVIEKTEPEGDTENTETEDEAKSDEITVNDEQEPDTGEASEDTPAETVEDTVEETTVEEEKTAETVSEDKETVEDVDSESKEDVVAGDDGNTEEKPVEQVEITGETHFVETADGVEDLDRKDFQTGRLVVLTDAAEDIIDQEHVIGTYGNIYLLQYKSVEQAMNAYIYYQTHASAVEPDVAVEAAETMETAEAVEEKTGGNITASEEEGSTAETVEDVGDNADNTDNKTETIEETPDIAEADISTSDTDVNTNIVDFEVSEAANPISAMNDAAGETTPVNTTDSDKVIALIDTGASESANIIERVSLIDDVMVGSNSHGDDMVKAIVSQNKNAKIISIRALGDDGQGTVSSIIAGIEYAINQKADIINLSLYARANLANEVVKTEIEKAINNGIEVVGAAGNDCANAKNYIPGSIDAAWIIGACDESGFRISFSNYGETVDYNVIAKSTSEAAAKFSGYISKFGTKDINFNKSELVNDNDDDSENTVLESDIFKTADDPLPYETKVLLIDYHNGKDSELPSGWQSGVGYTAANEMKAHFYKTRADKNKYMASASDTNDSDDFAYALRFSFCIEPGKTYSNYGEHDKVVRLDNRTGNNARRMTKAVFYLFGGPAFDVNATTADGKKQYNFKSIMNEYGAKTGDNRYSITHWVLAWLYAQGTSTKAPGASCHAENLSSDGKKYIKSIIAKLDEMPMPSETGGSLSKTSVNSSLDGNGQRVSESVTWSALVEDYLELQVPKNVTVINDATGTAITVNTSGAAKIPGNTTFHFVMPASMSKKITMQGTTTYPTNFRAYRTNDAKNTNEQEMCFSFYNAEGRSKKLSILVPTQGPSPTPIPTPTLTPTPIPVPCQVYVTKHSTATAAVLAENEYSVGGAVFGVYSDAGCSQEIGRVTTGDNSVSNPLQLPCTSAGNYTYYVKELAAPAGHNLNTEEKSVNVSLPTDNGKWFNVDFWDAAKFSHIQIKKVAADGTSWNDNLKGTEFSLYLGDTWLETISIQSSDFHAFQYGCLLGKTYTVKETKVMPGKIKSPDFNVTIDNEANYQPTYWYTVTNKDVPKVKVTKNVSEGNDNELLQLGYYSRANAVFEVYADAALQNLVGTLSTDENGETGELPLPCQTDGTYTYYVKETKAPDGHKITDTVKPVTVTLPQDAGTTKGVEFTDEPETDELTAMVKKASGKGNLIGDVVFKVCLYDGVYKTANDCPANMLKKTWYLKSDINGDVAFNKASLADKATNAYRSDKFYYGADKNNDGEPDIIIPSSKGCTITYQEVETPSEYVLDDTINIWKTKGQAVDVEAKIYYNDITPCKISINKFKEDGRTPLRGVKFKLSFIKESEPYTNLANPSYKPLLKVGESTEGTTDANGNITWSNLDQGEYQITEIQTVSGMTLLKDPIKITLPITMTDKQAKDMSAATDLGKFDNYTNKWYFYEATFDVTNNVSFKMPTTGADGVWKFIFFGFGTMAVLVTGLVVYDARNKRTRKRRRKQ